MKKLFFVALMAGVFGFQSLSAQTLTVRVVTNSSDDQIAVGITDDDSLCFDNVTVDKTDIYSWNNSTGVVTLNGDVLQTYANVRLRGGVNAFFAEYATTLYGVGRRNSIGGEATFSSDPSGQYTVR